MVKDCKIGDTAIAVSNIYLLPGDVNSNDLPKKLISIGQEFSVKDVKTLDCMALLELGVSRTKSELIQYDCKVCKKYHLVKNDRDHNIYFPSIWFKKPEKKTLNEKIKKMLNWRRKEDSSDKFLIPENPPSKKRPPQEVPRRIHEKERTKETVVSSSN